MRHPFALLLLWAVVLLLAPAARAQAPNQALPNRPQPFAFVTDQTGTLNPTETRNLERGLRSYADKTGTQVVVVLVKTLDGNDVADFAKALGNKWGVGQRERDNGLVIVVAPSEHKVGIAPGTGLAGQLPRSLTAGVIAQQFGPAFKRGNYYAGLRAGLNVLLKAADPSTASPAPAAAAAVAASETAPAYTDSPAPTEAPPTTPEVSPGPGGLGMGTLLLVLGGAALLWFLLRRRKAATGTAPYPGSNPVPGTVPDFLGNGPVRGAGGYGPTPTANSGNGMGGILGTAAAAAAGAAVGGYLMNRPDHPDSSGNASGFGGQQAGLGGGPIPPEADLPPAAAHDYFANRDGSTGSTDSGTDYFASPDNDTSADSGSYDNPSSDDSGGSFDSGSDDSSSSGSW